MIVVPKPGKTFRPSNWPERIAGNFASFEGGRLRYSSVVYPVIINGNKCLYVHDRLVWLQPSAYQSIRSFASCNDLIFVEWE